jgi:hypothetical protein
MNPEDVTNRKSFIQFVKSLRNEFETNSVDWENATLGDFLEALEVYSEEIEGYYNNVHPTQNADVASWRVFADILKGATMYE